jgi:hypothetical protein
MQHWANPPLREHQPNPTPLRLNATDVRKSPRSPGTRRCKMKIAIPNDNRTLRAGFQIKVRLQTSLNSCSLILFTVTAPPQPFSPGGVGHGILPGYPSMWNAPTPWPYGQQLNANAAVNQHQAEYDSRLLPPAQQYLNTNGRRHRGQ